MSFSFSQRAGLKPIPEVLQIGSMNVSLSNSLWNAFYLTIWKRVPIDSDWAGRTVIASWGSNFLTELTYRYLKQPVDSLNFHYEAAQVTLKSIFLKSQWHEVYDFIEFTLQCRSIDNGYIENFLRECNQILKTEMAGYRIIDNLVTPITNEIEIEAIEGATHSPYSFASQHLHKALELLSDRENPDYSNSIKESISATESICRSQFGGSTLGEALKKIEKSSPINGQLKSAFEKLYAYTNNHTDGIRHGSIDEPQASFDEAKFMLVTCSAFLNYLVSKAPQLN